MFQLFFIFRILDLQVLCIFYEKRLSKYNFLFHAMMTLMVKQYSLTLKKFIIKISYATASIAGRKLT